MKTTSSSLIFLCKGTEEEKSAIDETPFKERTEVVSAAGNRPRLTAPAKKFLREKHAVALNGLIHRSR